MLYNSSSEDDGEDEIEDSDEESNGFVDVLGELLVTCGRKTPLGCSEHKVSS